MHAGSKEFYCRYGRHYRPDDEKMKHGKNYICKVCYDHISGSKDRHQKDSPQKLDRFARWVR